MGRSGPHVRREERERRGGIESEERERGEREKSTAGNGGTP